jgi:hypothetical protein
MEAEGDVMSDRCLYYIEGYKYQVTRDCTLQTETKGYDIDTPHVRLTPDGKLTAKDGYAWNGASGPTLNTKSVIRPSLYHDIGYQLIRLGLIGAKWKEYFDHLLHDLMVEDGAFKWRADYYKWAVLKFGAGSCRPSAEPPELVAP